MMADNSHSSGAASARSPGPTDITSMMDGLRIKDEVQQLLREYMGNKSYNQPGRFSCYVVYRGRETGVFNTWYMTHHSVNGWPGNAYKGFHDRLEAEASYNDWFAFLERKFNHFSTYCSARFSICVGAGALARIFSNCTVHISPSCGAS
ncbi:hypothetical protein F5887DRAFT_921182 [Amanita rubescens]|nr:hypothetical protein F5887DRAFT_921182 [Amanita rubescens]